MGDRRNLRRRWITAAVVSLAAHGLVFLGLSLTPREGPPAPALPVFITLERLQPQKTVKPTPSPARAASERLQLHQPPAQPASVAPSGLTPAPPAPSSAARVPVAPGPPQQATAAPPLKLDCMDLGPAARASAFGREDCQQRRFPKLAKGDGTYEVPDNPQWEAQIARQQSVHRPLPPEKPFKNDCANSNLGLGCTEGMLWSLGKKKF
jgi:hypothetical protein